MRRTVHAKVLIKLQYLKAVPDIFVFYVESKPK